MIRSLIPLLTLSLISIFFTGCQSGGSAGEAESVSDGQILGLASSGETLTLKVGETFSVALPQNASTGYTWQLDDSYTSILKMPKGPSTQTYKTGAGTAGMVGAPTLITWTFVGKKVGEAPLKISYARSWETDKEPSKVFEVTVKVVE